VATRDPIAMGAVMSRVNKQQKKKKRRQKWRRRTAAGGPLERLRERGLKAREGHMTDPHQ